MVIYHVVAVSEEIVIQRIYQPIKNNSNPHIERLMSEININLQILPLGIKVGVTQKKAKFKIYPQA